MTDLVTLLAGIALIATAAVLFVLVNKRAATAKASANPPMPTGAVQFVHTQRPKQQLPILTAAELLERTGANGTLEKIRTAMGFHPQNFSDDVLSLIQRFAEYVQLLPASESHHHAQPGGLLIHTLDVAAYALTIRMGYKLPTGAVPEDQIRLGPAWTFGVLVAALLHDIGKPVADVNVNVFGEDHNKPAQAWNGLTGSLNQLAALSQANKLSHYTVEFKIKKDYQAHQRLGTTLLHALVPLSALNWLGADAALLTELMAYLDGNKNKDSALAEIVSKADQQSVADNLKSGPRTRFSAARSEPLIERLMTGLRTLMAEGQFALNRPGAAAFVDPDGVHIWYVAGVVSEQVRKILDEREIRPKEGGGIPSDNTRLFDTWQEYGALIEPPKEFGKGSVWWVRVQIDDWSQVLTVLKFPIKLVYPEKLTAQPAALRGTITPVQPTATRNDSATNATVVEATPHAVQSEPTASTLHGDAAAPSEANAAKPSAYDDEDFPDFLRPASVMLLEAKIAPKSAPSPSAFVPTDNPMENATNPVEEVHSKLVPDGVGDYLEDRDDAASRPPPDQPGQPVAAIQALRKTQKPPSAPFKTPGFQPKPNADRFVAWLQNSLGTGELGYNESDAVIHFVPEGMAIVSPKAFKLYLETNQWIGDLGESKDAMRALQNHLQKAGYLLFNKETKGYFHWYRTTKDDGSPGATITTYLISNPQAYVRPVPAFNTLLTRTTQPVKKSDKAKGFD